MERQRAHRRKIRYERHAALRARARLGGADLRIHRADVGDAWRRRRRCGPRVAEEFGGIPDEALLAAWMAEVVADAVVFVRADGVGLVDLHQADRIDVRHRAASRAPSSASMIGHSSVAPSRQRWTRWPSARFIARSSA